MIAYKFCAQMGRRLMLAVMSVMLFFICEPVNALSRPSLEKWIEMADSYVNICPDSALIVVAEIENSVGDLKSRKEYSSLLMVKGNAYHASGKGLEALAAFNKAIDAARRDNDTSMLINALSDCGVAYRVAQFPDSALACYNEALDLMIKSGDRSGEASLLTSIAVLYTNWGRIADAVPFARRGISAAERSGNIDDMMYAGSQGALILYKAGERKEGIDVERRVVAMAKSGGIVRYILKSYAAIIDMYCNNNQMDSALVYIEDGKRLLDGVPVNSVEAIGFMEESHVILSAMGRYAESLAIQKQLLSIGDGSMYVPLGPLWRSIARNYKALGDAENMAAAYERSIEMTDSVRSKEIDAQLSEFNVKYETAQKELEISRLEAEQSRARLELIVWAAFALIAIVSLVAYILVRRRKTAFELVKWQLDGIEQERGRLATELHDGVCNDLLGLGLMMQSASASQEECVGYLSEIRNEVRGISHELMPPKFCGLTLDDLLRDYARKQGEFVEYKSSGRPALRETTAYHVYRMVQEIIANIRKHTTATRADMAVAFGDGGGLELHICYNGKGIGKKAPGRGIGKDTLRRRAEIIGAKISENIIEDANEVVIRLV